MSSIQSSPAQIVGRVKYLTAIGASSAITDISAAFTPAELVTAIAAGSSYAARDLGGVINTNGAPGFIGSISTSSTYASGDQFRDMGKDFYVQTNGVNVYHFRLAQPVSGATTEGVPDNYATANVYICVWSAVGGANVVRSG
jgi:hypothetical protein